MTYYIYNTESSRIQMGKGNRSYLEHEYPTQGAAKAALTRMIKKAQERHDKLMASQYSWDHEKAARVLESVENLAIADSETYHAEIEQFETVYSMMDKDRSHPIRQSVNTPAYMDPSRESYWTM